MNVKKFTYTEFLEVVNSSTLTLSNLMSFYKNVVNFFYSYKDQRDSIYITGSKAFQEPAMLKLYESFGITFSSFIAFKKEFIVFIDPSRDLMEQIREQTKYIPDNELFTKLVVLSEDPNVVSSILAQVKELIPGIEQTQFLPSSDSPEDRKRAICEEMKIPLADSEKFVFDVTAYCNEIAKYSRQNHIEYLAYYHDVVNRIANEIGSRIAIYTGDSDQLDVFILVALELYLQHHKLAYIPPSRRNLYFGEMSALLVDPTYHLAEEIIAYIQHLPKAMFELSPLGLTTHFFKRRQIKMHVKFVPLESLDKSLVQEKVFSSSEITVKPISEFYDLDTIGGCYDLQSFIQKLYDIFDLSTGILDVTKLLFFGANRNIYVGLLENFDCSIEALTITNIGTATTQLNFKDLSKLFPVDCVIGGLAVVKQLCSRLKISFSPREFCLQIKPRSLGHVVRGLYLNVDSEWHPTDIALSTLGLYARTDSLLRLGFNEQFINTLGLQRCRETFDCFGGLNPVLIKSIVL